MDRRVIDYLERRMRVSRDNENRGGDRRDYERDRRDYDYERDERRGVKGTGPYGIGGRRYYGRDRADYDYDNDRNMSRSYGDRDYARGDRDYDYERGDRDYARGDRDYARGGDYNRDYEDRDYNMHQEMKLTKEDMHRWKQKMQNADGTKGEHYDMQQIMHAVEKLGIKMSNFDEKDLCLAVNMMYSDYCKVIKKYVPAEKELMVYVELAKAFLDDADGPKPEEKLALYYYCIVDNDEV